MEEKDQQKLGNHLAGRNLDKDPEWWYNLYEGGVKQPFEAPTDRDYMEKVANQVSDRRYWGRYPRSNPHSRSGSREYTTCVYLPNHNFYRIFALRFPNGWIWDSEIRMFCKENKTEHKLPLE